MIFTEDEFEFTEATIAAVDAQMAWLEDGRHTQERQETEAAFIWALDSLEPWKRSAVLAMLRLSNSRAFAKGYSDAISTLEPPLPAMPDLDNPFDGGARQHMPPIKKCKPVKKD